jgi:hypothetical protein
MTTRLVCGELEVMVIQDMMDLGMDPANPDHVQQFWEDRLPQEEVKDAN